VEKLDTLLTNVPIPSKEDSDDEESYNQKDHKRDKSQYKKKFYKKRKKITPKKTIVHLT
jgi:hypothetical protein